MENNGARFPVIGKYMVWKVGIGKFVQVGLDAIVDYGNGIFFPKDLVNHLRNMGMCTLYKVSDPSSTSIWSQS
jgi:hypothetical protein